MNVVGIATIALGLFVLATRLPLVVAPAATVMAYRSALGTIPRVRGIGVVVVLLGAAATWAGTTENSALAGILTILGCWVVLLGGGCLLLFPGTYREFVYALLPEEGAVELLKWRVLGALGSILGLTLVYYGVLGL
jgi:hypothetical protein